ncbi:MAG: hypothetical protein HN704_14745 [Bacteroidetes bacterium]|jgi:hypothetical protein|nr:hypothetical protein [Bacteroidota bacterium]MBT7492856.1 hypothetical protein [Bacteroidota bacterium]
MSKEKIIKALEKLKEDANEFSNFALMNEGYRIAIMDAIDLVEKLTMPGGVRCLYFLFFLGGGL